MLLHIQFWPELLRRLALWESLTGYLYGAHGKVLGARLQDLKRTGEPCVIANPKWAKAVKGNKDDTKDSKWIGDFFRSGLAKSSFIPDKDHSHPQRVNSLSLQAHIYEKQWGKLLSEGLYCLQCRLASVVPDMFGMFVCAFSFSPDWYLLSH